MFLLIAVNKKNNVTMKTIFPSLLLILLLTFPTIGKTQYVNISGNITNLKDGALVENANVYESISTIGTISNKNGNYQLLLKKGDVKIVISLNGFKDYTQKMSLISDTTLNVKLVPLENLKAKVKAEDKNQVVAISENKKSNRTLLK